MRPVSIACTFSCADTPLCLKNHLEQDETVYVFTGKGQVHRTLPLTPIPCLKYRSAWPSIPFCTRHRRQTGQIQRILRARQYGLHHSVIHHYIPQCDRPRRVRAHPWRVQAAKEIGRSPRVLAWMPHDSGTPWTREHPIPSTEASEASRERSALATRFNARMTGVLGQP